MEIYGGLNVTGRQYGGSLRRTVTIVDVRSGLPIVVTAGLEIGAEVGVVGDMLRLGKVKSVSNDICLVRVDDNFRSNQNHFFQDNLIRTTSTQNIFSVTIESYDSSLPNDWKVTVCGCEVGWCGAVVFDEGGSSPLMRLRLDGNRIFRDGDIGAPVFSETRLIGVLTRVENNVGYYVRSEHIAEMLN